MAAILFSRYGIGRLYGRSDGVQHVSAWQFATRRDRRRANWLRPPFASHNARAFQSQSHTCDRMDRIVDAMMVRHTTAGHARIRRVHDRIALQCGDVALPYRNSGITLPQPWRNELNGNSR